MKHKHKHYDLIVKYYADMSQKIWCKFKNSDKYLLVVHNENKEFIDFNEQHEYHIGDQPPKRKITMAGIEFDAPELNTFKRGDIIYVVSLNTLELFVRTTWDGMSFEQTSFNNGLVHLDQESAVLHAKALIALNKQLTK